jgi:hypothetical protein
MCVVRVRVRVRGEREKREKRERESARARALGVLGKTGIERGRCHYTCFLPPYAYLRTFDAILIPQLMVPSGVRRADRVMNNYGAKSNFDLALHYGFVVPGNPCDSWECTIPSADDGGCDDDSAARGGTAAPVTAKVVLGRKSVQPELAPPLAVLASARCMTRARGPPPQLLGTAMSSAGGSHASDTRAGHCASTIASVAVEDVYDLPPELDWSDPRSYAQEAVVVGDVGAVLPLVQERAALGWVRHWLQGWQREAAAATEGTATCDPLQHALARAYRSEMVGLLQEHLDALAQLESMLK